MNVIPTPENIIPASEVSTGAAEQIAADKAPVISQVSPGLEVLKQSIGPTIAPVLTIAGIAYITYLGIKTIITGKKPFGKGSTTMVA
ncbi:hypothetical protein KJ652_03110 [Patescibacteria group bacterium]|nr:hypothetical protein [Patescibacteria group bacterium]MBU1123557.1 hypothetical protein [Patescibacteria group bacterium]MBU1911608.1 hypothetical protein [Patescibacteria group bacterium]